MVARDTGAKGPAAARADLANPSALKPSGAKDRPSARTPPQPAARAVPAATDGAVPTNKTSTAKAGRSGALVLRSDKPPVDQLDFDDRHDTRATESEEMAQRYARLRKDYRRNDWHYLAMGLVVFVVGTAVYLAGFVVMSRLLPQISPRLTSQIVGLACVAAGGGVVVRSAGRALKQRSAGSRGRGSKST